MHNFYMNKALTEAELAFAKNEVPVGAIIVYKEKIIARAHNLVESKQDATMHAELIAMQKAAKFLNNWRLKNCTLYVTLEPCPMCAGAMIQCRLDNLVFGAIDPKAGAAGSIFNITENKSLNHQVNILSGIKEDACKKILKSFFSKCR